MLFASREPTSMKLHDLSMFAKQRKRQAGQILKATRGKTQQKAGENHHPDQIYQNERLQSPVEMSRILAK